VKQLLIRNGHIDKPASLIEEASFGIHNPRIAKVREVFADEVLLKVGHVGGCTISYEMVDNELLVEGPDEVTVARTVTKLKNIEEAYVSTAEPFV